MKYSVLVRPDQQPEQALPPGMSAYLVSVVDYQDLHQTALMPMVGPSDLLSSLAYRPVHAQRIAGFVALAARTLVLKPNLSEQAMSAVNTVYKMEATKSSASHEHCYILITPPQRVGIHHRSWPTHCSLDQLADVAHAEQHKITLECVAQAARPTLQPPSHPKPKL